MKRLLLVCFCCINCILYLTAQDIKVLSPYLFEDFKNAIILYKDGRQFAVPVNYDLIAGHFVFIDVKDDNLKKEFASPDLIAIIRIGNKTYLPTEKGATEVIREDFYVQYVGQTQSGSHALPYGGTTQTAAADSYSGLTGKGIVSGKKIDNRILVGISNNYEVKIEKKIRHFFDKKSFLKLIPKQQRNEIEKYVDSKQIDFNSASQVIELFDNVIKRVSQERIGDYGKK